MSVYYLILLLMSFISSLSQIFLKVSALEQNKGIRTFINVKVISCYIVYFLILFINSYFIYGNIKLNKIAIVESSAYIFVPFLSSIILKEKLEFKQILGIFLIFIGIILFNF